MNHWEIWSCAFPGDSCPYRLQPSSPAELSELVSSGVGSQVWGSKRAAGLFVSLLTSGGDVEEDALSVVARGSLKLLRWKEEQCFSDSSAYYSFQVPFSPTIKEDWQDKETLLWVGDGILAPTNSLT